MGSARKRIFLTFARYGLAVAIAMTTTLGVAQYNSSPTLKIGDPTPPIKVQTWLRGQPVTHFEKGKVYVLDFWATWCGGCIAVFPQISAIAEKYKDRVSFMSVDTYEHLGKSNAEDPLPKVTQFLKTPQGQKLTLNVCLDGNAAAMWDAWIKPLRRVGLPTTYVIDQEGKIAWVDVNLDHLDWVLGQVLAKTWDRDKAGAIMQQRDAVEDLMFKVFRNKDTDNTKDYQAMLAASEAFEKQFPDRKDAVAFYKFMALLELDMDKVPDLLERMAADPRSRYLNLADAAGLTLRKNNLSKRTYAAIAKVQERLLLNEFPGQGGRGGKSVSAYQELASTYDKAGDPANAVASIEKAITMANEHKASADQIKKLQEALDKYKAAGIRGN